MIYTRKTYIVERWGRVKKQTRGKRLQRYEGKRLQRYELRTQTTLTEPPCTWQSTWTSLYLTTEYLVWVWLGRRRELTWDTIWRWRECMWLDEFDSEGRLVGSNLHPWQPVESTDNEHEPPCVRLLCHDENMTTWWSSKVDIHDTLGVVCRFLSGRYGEGCCLFVSE